VAAAADALPPAAERAVGSNEQQRQVRWTCMCAGQGGPRAEMPMWG
jgi:hypothetical protein